jgi:hypothetical protein
MLSRLKMAGLATRLCRRGVTVRAMHHMTVARAASVTRKSVTGRTMNLTVRGRRIKVCVSTRVAGVTTHTAQNREERRRQAPTEEAGDEHCVHVR